MRSWPLSIALCVVATCAAAAAQDGSVPYVDPSPHQTQFVTVDEGVRLEVVDWGGTGASQDIR